MFCEKCGNQMKEGEKFCPKCGAAQEVSVPKIKDTYIHKQGYVKPTAETPKEIKTEKVKKERKKMSKGKKAKIICISILAVILVLAISLVVIYLSGSAFSTYRELKNGNYAQAVSTYKDDVEDNFIQKSFANMTLKNYAEKIVDNFKNNKIDFDSAYKTLNALKDMGIENADKYLEEITAVNNANKAYEDAAKALEDGDYENAIKEFSKVPEGNDKYNDAQAKLIEIYPKYIQSVSDSAEKLCSDGEYQQALSLINVALSIIPTESVDVSSLNTVKTNILNSYKQELLDDITALVNERKYTEAMQLADEAIATDDNEDFRKAKVTAETKYVENVTANVNNFLTDEDYISAARTVDSALNVLPENSALKELKSKVEKATPIYLLDVCKPYESDRYTEYINGEKFTMGGNEYTNGFALNTDYFGYAIFNLNGKYSSIAFNLGLVDGSGMQTSTVKIYFDDVLKSEYIVEGGSLPKRIDLNVTGVKQVKITVENHHASMYGFGNITVK